jgi:hypothetical protein
MQLITYTDFLRWKPIDANFKSESGLGSAIMQAQNTRLCDFLGEELYNDLLADSTNTPYAELLQGETYAGRKYWGLVPAIVFEAYAVLLENYRGQLTLSGAKELTAAESATPSDAWFESELQRARAQAEMYFAKADWYLQQKSADFPTYTSSQKGSFEIRTVKQFRYQNSK